MSRSGAQMGLDLDLVKEAESLGFDFVWTAEVHGADAIVPLTWIATHTGRIPFASLARAGYPPSDL